MPTEKEKGKTMIQNTLDKDIFASVVADALVKIHLSGKDVKRWVNAIAKATLEIENNPFLTWQSETNSLLIWSQNSSEIYEANGVCQCKAFEQGYPCYHRAAARLIQRYLEIVQ